MFGDLDWPLNASRGFVSISWASCITCITDFLSKIVSASTKIMVTVSFFCLATANATHYWCFSLMNDYDFDITYRTLSACSLWITGTRSVWLLHTSMLLVFQYIGDPSNVTWFPMQSFHVSAAVKAVSSGMGQLRFVEIDLPEAEASNHPPMFAFIARRTRGVKVRIGCKSIIRIDFSYSF